MTCKIHDVTERASHIVLGFQCSVSHIGLLQRGEITLLFFFLFFLLFCTNYKSASSWLTVLNSIK